MAFTSSAVGLVKGHTCCPARVAVQAARVVLVPPRGASTADGEGHFLPSRSAFSRGPGSDRRSAGFCDNDNDNDNYTLREVPHPSNEGLALQARVSGP